MLAAEAVVPITLPSVVILTPVAVAAVAVKNLSIFLSTGHGMLEPIWMMG